MKLFKKLMVAVLVGVSLLGLTACKKKTNENVSTLGLYNGGMVVNVGDYSIFVNGFKSYETINENNKNNDYLNSAILSVERDGYNVTVDDNGSMLNYNKLYNKISGYEITDLHVFGDYLFFTTPVLDKYESGSGIANDLTDFYRIRIDGSGKAERIIRSQDTVDNIQFGYYCDGSSVYLLTVENSNLYRTICTGKNIGNKILVASGVTEVLLPDEDNFTGVIYFTIGLSESDNNAGYSTGNKISSYEIVKNSVSDVKMDNKNTFTLVDVKGGYLYLYAKSSSDENQYLYAVKAEYDSIRKNVDEYFQITYSYNSSNKVYVLGGKSDGIIMYDADRAGLYKINPEYWGDTNYRVEISTEYTNVVKIQDEYVYCTNSDNNVIVKINYKDATVNEVADFSEDEDGKTIKTDDSKFFDIDNSYIYYYVKISSDESANYYLYRSNILQEESNASLFGVLEQQDIPQDEEEETSTNQ